jgi:hypothetical protein
MSCIFSSLGGKLRFIEDEAWLKREMKMALSNFDPIENHTHTHTHQKRKRKRKNDREGKTRINLIS